MISNLTNAQELGLPVERLPVAPKAGGMQPLPVIPGTESFAEDWLVKWHLGHHQWPEGDLACYSIVNGVVSGAGQVWLDGQLVTSPEIMPNYVAQGLDIANGGNEALRRANALPLRTIDAPCLVAVGHGIRVYGHFLIELLFRILIARRAHKATGLRYRILLDRSAPEWLLGILNEYLDVRASDIEFFQPERERVKLQHAIVPSLPLRDGKFHPATNDLLAELLDRLAIPSSEQSLRRVFIARSHINNPAAPKRTCVNEQNLIDIAATRYRFTPVAIETLPWSQQIALFRDAEIVLGVAGSGLHNALFSQPESRLASIGVMNLVQSQIGALVGQRNAYLSKGFQLSGTFEVDEEAYRTFLDRVCA